MNTKAINSAAGVINAALTQNRTAAGIALALDSAGMLMTPETAAELAVGHPSYDELTERQKTVAAPGTCGRALSTGEPCPDHPRKFVPRTERSYWEDIAAALNMAASVGMPVGIDLDGTLTDRHMWSVVWDRITERWAVAGYETPETGGA